MANKVYRAIETAIRFKDTDVATDIGLNGLGFGEGALSARVDRGAGSLPQDYKWKACIQFDSAPALGEYVEIYLAESDGTNADGNVGSSSAALTSGQKSNLQMLGIVRAQTADAATNFIASGRCTISERYFSVGAWNASAADDLKASDDVSWIELTPIPPEIQ